MEGQRLKSYLRGWCSLGSGEATEVEPVQDEFKLTPRTFAQQAGLVFSNWLLLNRALTHRSYLNEHPEALEDNERLEFLGDAVLDFIVGAWLYNHFPEMAEGELTQLRAALVSKDQLAIFAAQKNLGAAMLLGRGEEENKGRQRDTMLCDMFEAVIGAHYLDAGIEQVRAFVEPFLEPATNQILLNSKDQDPKSRLQEWAQSQGLGAPYYETMSEIGPDHAKVFEVEVLINGSDFGRGRGTSKQQATKHAAREALRRIETEM